MLGQLHPETLDSIYLFACLRKSLIGISEALHLFEDCLAKRRMVLGHNNPDTLTSMKSVALLYSKLNLFEKAIPLSEEAYRTSIAALGGNHPISYEAMHHLAILYDRLEKFDEALKDYGKALSINEFSAETHTRIGMVKVEMLSIPLLISLQYKLSNKVTWDIFSMTKLLFYGSNMVMLKLLYALACNETYIPCTYFPNPV